MRKWLRDRRNEKQLTEGELGVAVGISQVAYHLIETGERRPRPETAKKIAAVLGCDWTRFYEDDESDDE